MNCLQIRFCPLFLVANGGENANDTLKEFHAKDTLNALNEMCFYNSDFGIPKDDDDSEFLSFRFISMHDWQAKSALKANERLENAIESCLEGKELHLAEHLGEFIASSNENYSDILDEPLACIILNDEAFEASFTGQISLSIPLLHWEFNWNNSTVLSFKEVFKPFLLEKIFPFIQQRIRTFAGHSKSNFTPKNWLTFGGNDKNNAQNESLKAAELLFLVHDWKGAKEFVQKDSQAPLFFLLCLLVGEKASLNSNALLKHASLNQTRTLEFILYIFVVVLERVSHLPEKIGIFEQIADFLSNVPVKTRLLQLCKAYCFGILSSLYNSILLCKKASFYAFQAYKCSEKIWYLELALELFGEDWNWLAFKHQIHLYQLQTNEKKHEYLLKNIEKGFVCIEGLENALESLPETHLELEAFSLPKSLIQIQSFASDGILTTSREFGVILVCEFERHFQTFLPFISQWILPFEGKMWSFPFVSRQMKQFGTLKCQEIGGMKTFEFVEFVMLGKIHLKCRIEDFSFQIEHQLPEIECHPLELENVYFQGEIISPTLELQIIANPQEMMIEFHSPNDSIRFPKCNMLFKEERVLLDVEIQFPSNQSQTLLHLEAKYSQKRHLTWKREIILDSLFNVNFQAINARKVQIRLEKKIEGVEIRLHSCKSQAFNVEFDNFTLFLEPLEDWNFSSYISSLSDYFSGGITREFPQFPYTVECKFQWKYEKRKGFCTFSFNPSIDEKIWLSCFCKSFKRTAFRSNSILNDSQMRYSKMLFHYKNSHFSLKEAPLFIEVTAREKFTSFQSLMILQATSLFPEPLICTLELPDCLWIGQRIFHLELVSFHKQEFKCFFKGSPNDSLMLPRIQVKLTTCSPSRFVIFEGETNVI